METTSIKAPTTSGPARKRVARVRNQSTTQQRTTKSKQFSKNGTLSVDDLQSTIQEAFRLFFSDQTEVFAHFTTTGTMTQLVCEAQGITTTITMSENKEGAMP